MHTYCLLYLFPDFGFPLTGCYSTQYPLSDVQDVFAAVVFCKYWLVCLVIYFYRRQCFKAAWLAAVLHDGHHFPEDFDLFESVMEVKGTEVQWTLGAMVYLLHQPTQYYPSPVAERLERYFSFWFEKLFVIYSLLLEGIPQCCVHSRYAC